MKNDYLKICLIILGVVLNLSLSGCEENNTLQTESYQTGLWNNYIEYTWPHDGEPYSSENFWVYSDDASDVLKQQFADIAEIQFEYVIQTFNFSNTQDFLYPAGNEKLEIYINRFNGGDQTIAYWGGVLITSTPQFLEGEWLRYIELTLLHELTHSFEFLIEGHTNLGTDVWFREGIACYIAGVDALGISQIDTVEELEFWIANTNDEWNQGNPICIHRWGDFPPDANYAYYYVVFELALRYILSEEGLGKSLNDILNIFYDMRDGIYFHHSFENNIGISLADFRDEFYPRVREFLGNNN